MENFHLQNTDIKKIICDLGAHCLNRIPFIFWPVHLNNWIHLQTEIAVCLPSVKYKCSSKEKTSCSIPVSNSEQLHNFFFFLWEGSLWSPSQPQPREPREWARSQCICKGTAVTDLRADWRARWAVRIPSMESLEMKLDKWEHIICKLDSQVHSKTGTKGY